jgi:hypothetical protein
LPLPTVEECHFINDSSGPLDEYETGIVLRNASNTTNSSSSPSPPGKYTISSPDLRARYLSSIFSPNLGLSDKAPFLRDPRHGHLVSYYCEQLCPLTVTSERLTSPFFSLILPYCTSASTIVSDALLALSARHLSMKDNTWAITAVRLENTVIRELRHRLAVANASDIRQDHELPVVMMLMCMYEILNRSDQKWVVHLKGAQHLISARRAITGRDSSQPDSVNELTFFAERFFAFQDVIGRTACGEAPKFDSDYWDATDTVIDAWLGCSPALVSIVCSMNELSRFKSSSFNSTASSDFAAQAASLESSLSNLQQIVPAGGDDRLLLRSAEIKRAASITYLHCALYGASPRTPIVQDGLRKILRHVSRFLEEEVAAGLVWPVFVAAVELDPLEDELWKDESTGSPVYGRPLVLRLLEHMRTASIANVTHARQVICNIWDARDMAMTGDETTISREDDWDRFVAPESRNISLA